MKQQKPIDALNLFSDDENIGASPASLASPEVEYAGLKWSFSKHGVRKQCPRRFYYQYYGGNSRLAKDEADKDLLRRLKLLVNREERTGQLLHLAIATYLPRQ